MRSRPWDIRWIPNAASHNHGLAECLMWTHVDVLAFFHAVDRKPARSMLFSPHYLKADLSSKASLFQVVMPQTDPRCALLSPPACIFSSANSFSPFCSFKRRPRVIRSLKFRPYRAAPSCIFCLSWPLAISCHGNRHPMRVQGAKVLLLIWIATSC